MGAYAYRQMYGKQTLMNTLSMPKVMWSEAMTEPKVRAQYENAGKKAGRQPFHVAVSDFYAGKNLFKDEQKTSQ